MAPSPVAGSVFQNDKKNSQKVVSMKIRTLICDILKKQRCDLFRVINFTALLVSMIMGFGLFFIFVLIALLLGQTKLIPVSFQITFNGFFFVFLISFLILFIIALFQSRPIFLYQKDLKNDHFVSETVIPFSSEPVLKKSVFFLPDLICFSSRKEQAEYRKLAFRSSEHPDEISRVLYLNSKEKTKIWSALCNPEGLSLDPGTKSYSIKFTEDRPLRIVYGRKSRFLKEIHPAEGYGYTEEQKEQIEKWNRISVGVPQKKGILFMAAGLLLVSMGISLLLWGVIGLLDLLVHRFDYLLLSLFFFIPFYGLYIKDRLRMKFWEGLNIHNGKRDRKRNEFVKAKGILISTITISIFYDSLRFLFKEEKAKGHLCNFKLSGHSRTDYFAYILTKEKMEALREIYDIDIHSIKCSVTSSEITFEKNVPLMITYGKHSHILWSIAPAEGYDYTEEQLSAIEKFNTLYP